MNLRKGGRKREREKVHFSVRYGLGTTAVPDRRPAHFSYDSSLSRARVENDVEDD